MLRAVDRALATTLTSAADAVLALLLAPGNRGIAAALLFGLGLALLGSLWIDRELRSARYSVRRLDALAFAAIAFGQLGMLYVGLFSAWSLGVAPVLLI